MKTKNFILIEMLNTLNKFTDKKLPQKVSYAIMKNMDIIKNEYVLYEKQLRQIFQAYEEHFIKDREGNITYNNNNIPLVEDDYVEKFNNELQELLNAEVNINLCTIDRDFFDYETGDRYDCLTVNEMFTLLNTLSVKE